MKNNKSYKENNGSYNKSYKVLQRSLIKSYKEDKCLMIPMYPMYPPLK